MTWKHEQPSDREIRQALAELPRERAADGFTEQVLRRLDEIPPSRAARPLSFPFRWQPVLAGTAFAALLVAVLLAAGVLRPAHGPVSDEPLSESPQPVFAAADGPEIDPGADSPKVSLPATATPETVEPSRTRDSRTETVALLEELRREHTRLVRDLRGLRKLAEGSQVIYVGGDESLDLVLDLQPERPTGGGPDIRPATNRGRPGGGGRYF